jgi:hydrogenase large subunit
MLNGNAVVTNYVESLTMRRKAHTMSSIFSGRHPIQNAIVPGGVTSLPTATDVTEFRNLLDTVRTFINTAYVPDVVVVATNSNFSAHWTSATDPGNLLSYGDFPIQTGSSSEILLLKRGMVQTPTTVGIADNGPTAFLGNVTEDVLHSYYEPSSGIASYSGLHPSVGETHPDVSLVTGGTTEYTWLKAPRFAGNVCEVGPLPRMYVSYVDSANHDPIVDEASAGTSPTACTPLSLGGTTYKLSDIVANALNLVGTRIGTGSLAGSPTYLISLLGRHACRALECKLLADAMADSPTITPSTTSQAWLTELQNNGLTSPVYTYAKLPKKIVLGAGWAEAPRGALGHWITIDKKRIARYQCVVPTTWNHSPKDDSNSPGAAESALIGDTISAGGSDATILDILRYLHPYDFCIACAVHVVTPDGKSIAKVKMDTDGKVTKLPLDAEI